MHARGETIQRHGDSDSSYRSPSPESSRSGESPPYPAGNPGPRYDLEHIPVVLTHFVIAGLDPAIHPLRKKFLRRMMDPRVEPAGDASGCGMLNQADRNGL